MKIIVGFIVLASICCFAQPIELPRIEFSPKKYICYLAGELITIDGKLDENGWKNAEWTDDFVDIEGPVKPNPRFRTRAKMLWDENYFYVAAELSEPHIWATLKNRDDIIFYDNDFEIFIDPDGDTHAYGELEMNAFNTVWDLFLIQPYRDIRKAAIHAWDIKGLKTAVAIYGTLNNASDIDSCWTVEVAFPWETFKEITAAAVPPKNYDQWRINFSRVEWLTEIIDGAYHKKRNPATNKPLPEDNWVWSPQGIVNMHYPEMWGYVQFVDEVVGTTKKVFIENDDEIVKWFLRNLYYMQRIYFQNNAKFTEDLNSLGIELKQIKGYTMPPKIECTASMFEASIFSVDGSKKISIRNDGLIWTTKLINN
ncbi:MAG: carbohydrate-binding family 9-like protein [Bacteroidota bacterium]